MVTHLAHAGTSYTDGVCSLAVFLVYLPYNTMNTMLLYRETFVHLFIYLMLRTFISGVNDVIYKVNFMYSKLIVLFMVWHVLVVVIVFTAYVLLMGLVWAHSYSECSYELMHGLGFYPVQKLFTQMWKNLAYILTCCTGY